MLGQPVGQGCSVRVCVSRGVCTATEAHHTNSDAPPFTLFDAVCPVLCCALDDAVDITGLHECYERLSGRSRHSRQPRRESGHISRKEGRWERARRWRRRRPCPDLSALGLSTTQCRAPQDCRCSALQRE